jgi:hypothetical protein
MVIEAGQGGGHLEDDHRTTFEETGYDVAPLKSRITDLFPNYTPNGGSPSRYNCVATLKMTIGLEWIQHDRDYVGGLGSQVR